MKKIFTVLGPESSGTRLSANIFIESGIKEIAKDTKEMTDIFTNQVHIDIIKNNENMVLRKSIPHGRNPKRYVKIKEYIEMCKKNNIEPYIVIPIRIYEYMIPSKQKRHNDYKKGNKQEMYDIIYKEYMYIFENLKNVKFYLLSTSSLMLSAERELKSLSKWSGINLNTDKIKSMIYDADKKWL